MSLPIPTWGLVTLNDVEMDAPGRVGLNSYVLMDGAKKRRSNVVRPGVAGERGGPGYPTPRDVRFEVFLDGRWDADGEPSSDPVEAVASHILYLRTNILEDPGDDEGAVTCTVTSAAPGYLHEGPVQVDDLVSEPGIGAQVVIFDLVILRGALDITGGS